MAERTLLIELVHDDDLAESAQEAARAATAEQEGPPRADLDVLPELTAARIDPTFAPQQLPGSRPRSHAEDDPYDVGDWVELATSPRESTYVVRGLVEEDQLRAEAERLRQRDDVVGVFADPVIEPTIVCPGDPAVGTDADVERLLCVDRLRAAGADGSGVLVAIVDTGINMAYLNSKGKHPSFDPTRSWVPRAGLVPGALPVGHGTMCAFDAAIAAPACTLLDVAVLQSRRGGPSPMSGVLSDAVRAYSHLLQLLLDARDSAQPLSMVVNNSWGMFHPSWDFPVGDPGNYSDNPDHPFNRIVASLDAAGADILFAAGNCGRDCPDGRCQGVTAGAIYGANGHPSVLCVAGVDTTRSRVGYSTVGPGRLTRDKPDLSGYTHFRGSGVYPADGGTSAATPVVAGVLAAVRSRRPYNPSDSTTAPAALRNLMRSSADDLGTAGYDFEHGHGVVSGCRLADGLEPERRDDDDLCERFPWLCRSDWEEICRRYPWLCRLLRRLPTGPWTAESGEHETSDDPVTLAYRAGFEHGQAAGGADHGGARADGPGHHGCGCA